MAGLGLISIFCHSDSGPLFNHTISRGARGVRGSRGKFCKVGELTNPLRVAT